MIAIIAGTRPEAIKLSPVMEALEHRGEPFSFVWSGQHYDYMMRDVFFDELGIPFPNVDLKVGSGSHAEQTSKLLVRIEQYIRKEHPRLVLAQGDTNTVLAASLAAAKLRVPFGHVEAGLRSWDLTMPEEVNRVVADSVSSLAFAPTDLAVINLLHQGISQKYVYLTGNTIVDVVQGHLKKAKSRGARLRSSLGVDKYGYIMVTIHRAENTEDSYRLTRLVSATRSLSKRFPVVFPIHPRTKRVLNNSGLLDKLDDRNIILTGPLGYLEFLGLLSEARTVLTDSGGVQEEAFLLGIPTVTLRTNTERPETVRFGHNILVGFTTREIIKAASSEFPRMTRMATRGFGDGHDVFGNGTSGRRIARICSAALEAGLKIESSDFRADPYITYFMRQDVGSSRASRLALYDGAGMATSKAADAKTVVHRGPSPQARAGPSN